MSAPKPAALSEETIQFARVALEKGALSRERLTWAIAQRAKATEPLPLPDLLVRAKLLKPRDVVEIREAMAEQELEPAPVEPTPAELAEPEPSTSMPLPPRAVHLNSSGAALDDAQDETTILFLSAAGQGASDLHLHVGVAPCVRIHGELIRYPGEGVKASQTRGLVQRLLSDAQLEVLEREGQIDFACRLSNCARLRMNAYRRGGEFDVVARFIPIEPPTLEQLNLPPSLAQLTEHHQGLILFTGPAGCGKSSTLAAVVRLLNEGRSHNIITVEDPIEYVHTSQRGIVSQRQVQKHTQTFGTALRAALREDPDVIVVGELRDLETISLALSAAETGHLVLATIHTSNAVSTLSRVIGAFPPQQQEQIRTMVSESLLAIVSQRLLPRKEAGGQVPALEILKINAAVSHLIRDGKTHQIPSVLQSGSAQGMCQLEASVSRLLADGVVVQSAALAASDDPSALRQFVERLRSEESN